jgi:putative hydrolase of the HAD superfamily
VRPTLLLLDVGGVLLTNGWDGEARSRAVDHFGLDSVELEERHEAIAESFEIGTSSLDEYLDHVIFHQPRPFDRDAVRRFMERQSHPHADALSVLARLGRTPGLTLATLNNESLALNRYRIETFGLKALFTAFFSSCYVGVRKPDPAIFRLAVRVMQRDPSACLFVDDREENVEAARRTGLPAARYRGAAWLQAELEDRGIELPVE